MSRCGYFSVYFDTIYKEAGSGCNNVSPYGITDIKFSKILDFQNRK
ncbi:hypothetical protein [Candidatus Aquarickettsia rohweri]|nr:hypothetical protein [Candidatus Aquarickettsia rohweri]